MTSRENQDQTRDFFEAQGSFGLDPALLSFFPQGELPVVDAAGKILMAAKDRLALGPNGNGGCFQALMESGALEDMAHRGVEWIFVYSVDNALVRVCDPRFLGFAAASGLPVAAKAVPKSHSGERVGVFCLRGGRPAVLEYSETPPEMAEQRDARGLVYGAANIAIHLFRRDVLER
jgi:UDP-N-acetylglucosamine pyrophosphorylase